MKENITILRNKFIPSTLVNYQDGAIVSRTLIEKPEGTVTLFAFDKGQKLSEHTAPFDALVQILEGDGTISIAGKEQHLSTGEAVVMPATIPHAVHAGSRFKMMLTMIHE